MLYGTLYAVSSGVFVIHNGWTIGWLATPYGAIGGIGVGPVGDGMLFTHIYIFV